MTASASARNGSLPSPTPGPSLDRSTYERVLGVTRSIANAMHLPLHLRDELIDSAMCRLAIEDLPKYNAQHGHTLAHFLCKRAKYRLVDASRVMGPGLRHTASHEEASEAERLRMQFNQPLSLDRAHAIRGSTHGKRPSSYSDEVYLADIVADPDDPELIAEARDVLVRLVHSVAEDERDRTMLLLLAEGYKLAEVGAYLGISESAVCLRRKKLRQRMETL